MNLLLESLLVGWRENQKLARQLLADLPDDAMTRQPHGAVNHPAWTLAHLNHYHAAIRSLARGEAVADPGTLPDADRYDAGSTPVDDPAQYPDKATLLTAFDRAHEEIEAILQAAPAERFSRPPGLKRWAEHFHTTANALVYLMVYHEAVHLGQIMTWKKCLMADGRGVG